MFFNDGFFVDFFCKNLVDFYFVNIELEDISYNGFDLKVNFETSFDFIDYVGGTIVYSSVVSNSELVFKAEIGIKVNDSICFLVLDCEVEIYGDQLLLSISESRVRNLGETPEKFYVPNFDHQYCVQIIEESLKCLCNDEGPSDLVMRNGAEVVYLHSFSGYLFMDFVEVIEVSQPDNHEDKIVFYTSFLLNDNGVLVKVSGVSTIVYGVDNNLDDFLRVDFKEGSKEEFY